MARKLTVYCAGAIRGDVSYRTYYKRIINIAEKYADVKTEISETYKPLAHFFDEGEKSSKQRIYERDMQWLSKSDAVISECSGASTGVGLEIGYAIYGSNPIPTICFIYCNSTPSLMIAQNDASHIIVQKYRDEQELEFLLRCFLKVLSVSYEITEIRERYFKLIEELSQQGMDLSTLDNKIDKILSAYPTKKQNMLIEIPGKEKIDFKNASDLFIFFFKALILQKRWEHLKSQRIGKTFVSGRKWRIINVLSQMNTGDIYRMYDQLGKKTRYTELAFAKNLRAYRAIGLLSSSSPIGYGSPKIKDNLAFEKTFDKRVRLMSFHSKRKISPGDFVVSKYLKDLSDFNTTFKSSFLVELLNEAMDTKWFDDVPELPTQKIDSIDVMNLLNSEWAYDIIKYINEKKEFFYKKYFSSFYMHINRRLRKPRTRKPKESARAPLQ